MISKDMCRFLKKVPLWPENKSQDELDKIPFMNKYLKLHLLMNAIEKGYVGSNGEDENSGFYLSESGREAIEEYKQQKASNNRSWIAIIISLISLLISLGDFGVY